jgi:hypothetical protein
MHVTAKWPRHQWRKLTGVLCPLTVGLLVLGAVPRVPFALASAGAGGKTVVLQTFRSGTVAFDLAIAACRASECPVRVQLVIKGKVVDSFTLPVAAHSQRPKAETVDPLWGADVGLRAWATGVEGQYVSTVGRPLTVASGTTGLLVTQRFGFEHLKRNHLFVVPRAGKVAVVWKAEEGAGPTWSATHILDNARGTQDIAYFRGFSEPSETTADRLDAIRLSWNEASATFRETPLPDGGTPLYLLSLGTYETVAQARHERFANAYCLSPYWVLDASRFSGVSGGNAVVGMLYVQRAMADSAARSVKECLPSVNPSVVHWTEAR